MIFQWFLRGVSDNDGKLDRRWAKRVLNKQGLRSAWLRTHPRSDPATWDRVINYPDSLQWHINRFTDFGFPAWPSVQYHDQSPFLSLSSGVVEPDHHVGKNRKYPAVFTAVLFATDHASVDGWVFHGYANLLGRPSLPLLEYSEEVRDLNQYDFYNPYHPEGELIAKVLVPPVRLKQAFRITADRAWDWLERSEADMDSKLINPMEVLTQLSDIILYGDSYRAPDEFCNIRGVR